MDSTTFLTDWFKQISVLDELHVAAIDNLLLEKKSSSTITGITKVNGRWIPIEGIHSIKFTDKTHIEAQCSVNDKERYYKIKADGGAAIKTIHRILNATRIKITNDAFISEIDNYIMTEMKLMACGNYLADIVCVPLDGIYTLSKDDTNYMVARKNVADENNSYTVDIVGKHFDDKLKTILNGDANRIRVVNCTIVNGSGISVRLMNKPPLTKIYDGQKTIVDYVINTYKNKSTKNVTVLVTGDPGVGKSTLAFLIAQEIKKLGVDPYLIKGFNVMSDEMQYHPIIGHYSPKNDCPVILLLDEFDLAMKRADDAGNQQNGQNGQRDDLAIASNKTNLNNFLDALNDESFLIAIATTNTKLKEINDNYGVYCRKGRFDKHFEMVSKDVTNMSDPVL